jgi:broad specificity phosphatase PhoE
MELIEKEFFYLRHGETDWNKLHQAMGQEDIELNATGIAQALAAAQTFLPFKNEIDLIFASPLKRAHKTAQIVSEVLDREVIELTELMEIKLGVKQGQPFANGEWLSSWEQGEIIEGAEKRPEFLQRFTSGLNKALDRKERVLIVSHGLAFKQLGKLLLNQEIFLPNCAALKCSNKAGIFTMEILNS